MDPVDTALASLRDHDHPVFSTHGPMAVEALEALGYGDAAPDWARDYRESQQLAPLARGDAASDLPALGEAARRPDWVACIERELDAEPWRAVVRRRLPALLPATSCEAAHGVIRVAHAVRSLARRESPARRHELAEALGYWSATFETLPGAPGRGQRGLASEALPKVPTIPLCDQLYRGSITDRLRSLAGLSGFEEAVSSLEPGDDLAAFTHDLAVVSARLYLANASRARVIDFIHAVDGVYAIRELAPFLDEPDLRVALFYGWQTVAALHASAGGPLEPARVPAVPAAEAPDLVARAVAIGGPHAIKFAQACLALDREQPDPSFPAALADAVVRMEELKEKLGLVI